MALTMTMTLQFFCIIDLLNALSTNINGRALKYFFGVLQRGPPGCILIFYYGMSQLEMIATSLWCPYKASSIFLFRRLLRSNEYVYNQSLSITYFY